MKSNELTNLAQKISGQTATPEEKLSFLREINKMFKKARKLVVKAKDLSAAENIKKNIK